MCHVYSDIIDPSGDDDLGSSPALSSPSPSLTRDDDDLSLGAVSSGSLTRRQPECLTGSESPQRPFRPHAKVYI